MKPDDEWELWAADFRHAPGPTPEASAIVEAARRGTWKLVATTTFEVATNVAGIVVFALLSMHMPAVWPLAALVMPGIALLTGYSLHVRAGTWTAQGRTMTAFVDLAYRRKRAELRLLRFGRALIVVFSLAFMAWLPFFLAGGHGRPDLGMPFLIARLVFACVTFAGTWLYLAYKIRRVEPELARIEHVRDSLAGEADGSVAL